MIIGNIVNHYLNLIIVVSKRILLAENLKNKY